MTPEQLEAYRGARKTLRALIKKSKESKWKELCEEIEQDPWGKGYKIAMKRLGGALPELPPELLEEIALFPRQDLPAERNANDELGRDTGDTTPERH